MPEPSTLEHVANIIIRRTCRRFRIRNSSWMRCPTLVRLQTIRYFMTSGCGLSSAMASRLDGFVLPKMKAKREDGDRKDRAQPTPTPVVLARS